MQLLIDDEKGDIQFLDVATHIEPLIKDLERRVDALIAAHDKQVKEARLSMAKRRATFEGHRAWMQSVKTGFVATHVKVGDRVRLHAGAASTSNIINSMVVGKGRFGLG